MPAIHPTAIVADGAELGPDVRIGPYCTLGPEVRLGDGVELISHVVVAGRTEIGARTRIFPFATVGLPPQDQKYAGEPSRLVVGARNIIREHVTMHPGTASGGMVTRIGDDGLFMVGCHVAHDCAIGDHVILVNNATMGGHVQIDDYAILGGLSAVHQFVRIGAHSMVGGASAVGADVIPYGLVTGNRALLNGLNIIGLKRRAFERDTIHTLRGAYRLLFAPEGSFEERLADVTEMFGNCDPVMDIVNFVRRSSQRGICQPSPDGEQ